MTEQRCVRTYDIRNYSSYSNTCIEDLNGYLKCGWRVISVIPKGGKEGYNEYIIEKEIEEKYTKAE